MQTDFPLSAYCHGNVDFPNVWDDAGQPTRTIPIYKEGEGEGEEEGGLQA